MAAHIGIMSETGHTVQVTNLSSRVSESDLHEFFSFSGPIEHIELIRSEGYGATAYMTFKERFALETAVLLSGATIVDQPVCITYWGQPEGTFNFWDRPTWEVEEQIEYRRCTVIRTEEKKKEAYLIPTLNYQTCQYNTTPQEAFTVAQDIMKTMLEKGYVLSKDALAKARAFDESYGLTAAAAARAAELSKRIGLTDRVNAGVGAMRSVDETYGVRETTKTVATATGRTAAKVVNGIVTSSYFSAGAMILSDALTRAAKAAADLAAHGRQN
ncbi:Binding partner of ACD11 1 [Zea mays]|uniref:Binding partner of ACD11 1 n=1 Tax=Zea mays TaxID=4577 RepID=A0A3L6FZ68_MAIZE|nr:Binding partner of ACD11 1 [Zea mays]